MTTASTPPVSSTNYRIFFITIGFISAMLFMWARTPFNYYEVNLLDVNNARVVAMGSTTLEYYALREQNAEYVSTCEVSEEAWVSRCGVTLILPQTAEGEAFSFNKIDTLHATIKTKVPTGAEGEGRLRLTLKTPFDDTIHEPVSDAGFKLHAVRLESGAFNIPLSRIDVDSDWQDLHKVSFAEAQKDFTHVHSIDLNFNDTPLITPGRYELYLSELSLDGHLVELDTLNNWLLTFWLFLGVGGILHLAWRDQGSLQRMRRVALFDSETELLNERGVGAHAV